MITFPYFLNPENIQSILVANLTIASFSMIDVAIVRLAIQCNTDIVILVYGQASTNGTMRKKIYADYNSTPAMNM